MKTEQRTFIPPSSTICPEDKATKKSPIEEKKTSSVSGEGIDKKPRSDAFRSTRRPAIARTLERQLARSNSAPPKNAPRLAPEFRKFDTLQHPLSNTNALNPGTLMLARNHRDEWERIVCAPDCLLHNVEIRPKKGLLNLTASARFSTGELSQAEKRDLQRAIVSVAMAYNEAAVESGASPVSIHENHIKGDGNLYPDRQIPREPNEQDYDYYHTLGVTFTDSGKALPHYHLEFQGSLDRQNVEAFLDGLRQVGQDALGKDILKPGEIASILEKIPGRHGSSSMHAATIVARHRLLPSEIHSREERSQRRDELESAFIALSSQNTELASERLFIRNAHMNAFRIAEPLLECFSAGHTSVMDDLMKIEARAHSPADHALDTGELLSIHDGLSKAHKELSAYAGATTQERDALLNRLQDARAKVKKLLIHG